jgi:hypothetical protein
VFYQFKFAYRLNRRIFLRFKKIHELEVTQAVASQTATDPGVADYKVENGLGVFILKFPALSASQF